MVSCFKPVLNQLKIYSKSITAYLYKGCLNQSYFLNNRLNLKYNTRTSASSTFNITSKKRLKASLKAKKKKTTKASSKGPVEDAKAINKQIILKLDSKRVCNILGMESHKQSLDLNFNRVLYHFRICL